MPLALTLQPRSGVCSSTLVASRTRTSRQPTCLCVHCALLAVHRLLAAVTQVKLGDISATSTAPSGAAKGDDSGGGGGDDDDASTESCSRGSKKVPEWEKHVKLMQPGLQAWLRGVLTRLPSPAALAAPYKPSTDEHQLRYMVCVCACVGGWRMCPRW